jgi:hypothetical protein
MNLLTSLHFIFQHEESLRRGRRWRLRGWRRRWRLRGWRRTEDRTPRRRRTRRRRRGARGGGGGARGQYRVVRRGGGGDGSASGPASSRRVRTSHLVHPPVTPCEENMIVIIPSDDG